jgi:hypothetical protein
MPVTMLPTPRQAIEPRAKHAQLDLVGLHECKANGSAEEADASLKAVRHSIVNRLVRTSSGSASSLAIRFKERRPLRVTA